MARIPLGELDDARQNPAAYWQKLEHRTDDRRGETYINALRQTIFRFHDTGDFQEARIYLENRLANSKLRSMIRKAATVDQFEWYADEYATRGWPLSQTKLRLRVPLPRGPVDLYCSGEVARLDIVPTGGYAAWLFCGPLNPAWRNELRMPLVQATVAEQVLGVPTDEVQIGIYSFQAQVVDLHRYSLSEIGDAKSALDQLLASMGF